MFQHEPHKRFHCNFANLQNKKSQNYAGGICWWYKFAYHGESFNDRISEKTETVIREKISITVNYTFKWSLMIWLGKSVIIKSKVYQIVSTGTQTRKTNNIVQLVYELQSDGLSKFTALYRFRYTDR